MIRPALQTILVIGTVFLAARPNAGERPNETAGARPPLRGEVRSADESSKSAVVRRREGTTIEDQIGTVVDSGRRFWFRPSDGTAEMRILENLALDRVVQTLDDTRTDHSWSISGVVTEYQGENYLLLRRAVLTSRRATATGSKSAKRGS